MRYANWQDNLKVFLLNRNRFPFQWGVSDCALFACDAIHTMNGSDPAHFFRGKYANKEDAFVWLKKFAGGGLFDAAKKIVSDMGCVAINNNQISLGDLVYVNIPKVDPSVPGSTMSIAIHSNLVVAQGQFGLVYIDNPEIVQAWSDYAE